MLVIVHSTAIDPDAAAGIDAQYTVEDFLTNIGKYMPILNG